MQEVFEKIKKNLVTELTFCSGYPNCSEYDYAYEVAMYDARNKATAIVNQVAEEYNNGWIPVEERLPKTPKGYGDCYWCTLKSEKYNETICKVVQYARFRNGNFWQLSREDSYIKGYKVIAWQPLPEPYQPKGDKE